MGDIFSSLVSKEHFRWILHAFPLSFFLAGDDLLDVAFMSSTSDFGVDMVSLLNELTLLRQDFLILLGRHFWADSDFELGFLASVR